MANPSLRQNEKIDQMKDYRFRLRAPYLSAPLLALGLGLQIVLTMTLPGTALAQERPGDHPGDQPGDHQATVPTPTPTGPAAAAPVPSKPEEIEALIKTLDDAPARDALKRQLQLLLQAQQPPGNAAPVATPGATSNATSGATSAAVPSAAPAETSDATAQGLGAQMLATLSDHVEKVSTALVNLVEMIADLPQRARQAAMLFSNPEFRAYWTDTALDLVAVLGAAFLAGWVTRRLLAGARRNLDARRSDRIAIRLLFLSLRFAVEILPVVVFGIAGYVVLPFFDPNQATRLIALVVVNA
jgi:hypothetical protein